MAFAGVGKIVERFACRFISPSQLCGANLFVSPLMAAHAVLLGVGLNPTEEKQTTRFIAS